MQSASFLQRAFEYVARGWRVLLLYGVIDGKCSCQRESCPSPGKHPLTKHGLRDATNDRGQILAWGKRWPEANIGIATGAVSLLMVLDIDERNGGEESLRRLTSEFGELPKTLVARTGGGRHLYFKHPGRPVRSVSGQLGKGLDIKADGGYVVAPPSIHWSGKQYEWENGDEIAEAPAWLLAKMEGRPKNSQPNEIGGPRIAASTRNVTLTSLAGLMRSKGMTQEEIETCLLAVNRRCDPPLSEDEVKSIARSISRYPAPELGSGVPERGVLTPVWPAPLDKEAFYGLAGRVVDTIFPESEADRAALLVQFLVAFGNVIGRNAGFQVESTNHYLNLFSVLAGKTSKSRKGTSWDHIERLCRRVDELWVTRRIQSGLSSGEGVIWNTRDASGEGKKADPGESDKRLLIQEAEFSQVLQVTMREGSIVSEVLRLAWDSGKLRILNKNSPAVATGAHVSVIGHITIDELKRLLTETQKANGFANRFLWVVVQRSKLLSEGGRISDGKLNRLVGQLRKSVAFAKQARFLRRDLEARFKWNEVYGQLSEAYPGLFGAIVSRAEAQVMRLAAIYALLDQSAEIRLVHLEAALAVWRYAEASAKYIFGNALGDPTADTIWRHLQDAGKEGVSRTELSTMLGRHQMSSEITRALNVLAEAGLAYVRVEGTDGRPCERWFATRAREKSERSE